MNWQSLIRDGVRVMLGRCPDALAPAQLGDHSYFGFFATDDVDGLHREFDQQGALILFVPADKPWGKGARWRYRDALKDNGMMLAQWIGGLKSEQ